MLNEYFDDIGLGSYYERRYEKDLRDLEHFKKMRTDHATDAGWTEEARKGGKENEQ